jgi:hypothetical protein
MWHCPHCGAPQAETARCWVCRKSSTTCSTCRHFRASLVSDIGYCALDRARRPLTGRELRGCWTERPATVDPQGAGEATMEPGAAWRRLTVPLRGFVPLDEIAPTAVDPEPPVAAPIILLAEGFEPGESGTSLFGELDR